MDSLVSFDDVGSSEPKVNGEHHAVSNNDPFGFDPFSDNLNSKTTTVTVTSKSSSGFDDFDPFSGGFTTTTTTTTTHTGSEDPFSGETSGHRFDDQFADLMGGFDGSPRVEGGHEESFRGSNGGGDFDHQHYSDQNPVGGAWNGSGSNNLLDAFDLLSKGDVGTVAPAPDQNKILDAFGDSFVPIVASKSEELSTKEDKNLNTSVVSKVEESFEKSGFDDILKNGIKNEEIKKDNDSKLSDSFGLDPFKAEIKIGEVVKSEVKGDPWAPAVDLHEKNVNTSETSGGTVEKNDVVNGSTVVIEEELITRTFIPLCGEGTVTAVSPETKAGVIEDEISGLRMSPIMLSSEVAVSDHPSSSSFNGLGETSKDEAASSGKPADQEAGLEGVKKIGGDKVNERVDVGMISSELSQGLTTVTQDLSAVTQGLTSVAKDLTSMTQSLTSVTQTSQSLTSASQSMTSLTQTTQGDLTFAKQINQGLTSVTQTSQSMESVALSSEGGSVVRVEEGMTSHVMSHNDALTLTHLNKNELSEQRSSLEQSTTHKYTDDSDVFDAPVSMDQDREVKQADKSAEGQSGVGLSVTSEQVEYNNEDRVSATFVKKIIEMSTGEDMMSSSSSSSHHHTTLSSAMSDLRVVKEMYQDDYDVFEPPPSYKKSISGATTPSQVKTSSEASGSSGGRVMKALEGEGEYANLSEANYVQPDHYVEDDTYANHPSHLEGEGEDGIYEELHDGEGGHTRGYHDPHYLEPQGAGGYQYDAEPVETGYDEAEYQDDTSYNQSGPGRGSSPDRFDQDHRASDGVTRTEVTQKSVTGGSVTTVRVISQRSGGSSGHREVSDDVTDQHMESRSAPHYYESSANDRSSTKYEQQHSDSKSPGIYFSEAADDNSCCKCGKRVYEMEKITADLMIYHKACFRCMKCNRILSLGNYASLDGRMYCKPHFIEIFKTKGNYGESFSQTSEPNKPVNAEGQHYTEQNDHADSRPVNRYSDNEDNDDDGSLPKGMKKEELPTVAIKSVRSMFEKMAVDTETGGQITPYKVSSTSRGVTPSTGGGRGSGNRLVAEELSGGRGSDVHDYGRGSSPSGSDQYNDQHDGDGRSGDVVQGSTTALVEEELPPVSMARNMVARFQQLQQDQGTASPAPVKHSTGHSGGASTGYGSTGGQAYKMPSVNYESPAASTANDKPVKKAAPVTTSPSKPDASESQQTNRAEEEMPQQGLARSLLQHWKALEAASAELKETNPSPGTPRGRAAGRAKFDARRSQSMSRAETTQRAREYRGEASVHTVMVSREVESIDDTPAPHTTRERLALYQQLQAESEAMPKYLPSSQREQNEARSRTFKWQVKNDIPASRKGIVVGGDAARLRTPHNPQTSSRPSSESQDSPRGGSSSEADYSAYSHGSNDAYHDTGDQGAVHSEIKEEELPAPSTTRNLLQHFKSMEDVSKAPPTPQQATNPRKTTATPSRRVTEELDDRDGPVIKESDGLVEAELPAQGTTRNLMAMFQSGR